MPNWVYNSVSVSGETKDLLAFAEKAKRPHTTQWLSPDWIRNEDGTNTKVEDKDRTIIENEETPTAISFWNFLRPTDEEIPYYFGHKVKAEDVPDDSLPTEERMAKALKFEGSGWYDWNIRNWGCKWDAGSDELDEDLSQLDGNIHNTLTYRYETAWSIPEGAMVAMVSQHPELSFDFHCEEEQGWGAEFTGNGGSLVMTREWDVPDSHADYVDRDNEGACVCAWQEDTEDWYQDCPRPEQDFYVVITKTYKVRTNTAENAWELAEQNANNIDDLMELVEDETTSFVKDEYGKRVFPTFSDGVSEPKECSHKFVPLDKIVVEGGVERIGSICVFCDERQTTETEVVSL